MNICRNIGNDYYKSNIILSLRTLYENFISYVVWFKQNHWNEIKIDYFFFQSYPRKRKSKNKKLVVNWL